MRLIVTGGCGFIGSNFVSKYKDHVIKVVDMCTYAADESRVDAHILRKENIVGVNWAGLIDYVKPDAIINFAASSHVDNSITDATDFIQSNYLGVFSIIKGVREAKHKTLLFQIGTDEEYGDLSLSSNASFTEDTSIAPNNPYSATKAAASVLIQAYQRTYKDFDYIITRASNNYGPNQHTEKLLPVIINSALNNKSIPIYGTGANIREWLYVEDFIDGVFQLVLTYQTEPDKVANQVFNFGSNVSMANIDMVKTILKLMDKPETLIRFVEDRKGHDRKYAMDYSKVTNAIGWKPKQNLEDGLTTVIDYFKGE